MTGARKYHFALLALLALVIGGGVAVWRGDGAARVFEEYVFGLFLLVAGFGGANGVEHIAGALKARRLPAGEAK
jgi:hypothetical protein